ncbi:hypothetical protein AcW1_004567 [Taiwanofungus camphoratus]|nr:hypothetical protein AcW1_004567 [Antrodia cinnamomea]
MQYTLGLFNLRPSYIRGSRHTLHIRQLWLFLSALICRSAFAMSVDNANHSQQDLSRKSKKSRGKHEPSGGHIIASEVKEGRQGIMQERGATEQFVEGTKRDKKRKKRHEEGIAHVQHESHGVSDGKPSKLKRRKEHLDGPKGKFKDLSDEKKRKAEIDDEDVAAHDNTEQLSNGMGDGENSGHETGGEEERKGGQTQPNKTRQKRRAHGTGEEIIRDEQKIKTKKGKKRKDTVDAREERDGAREVHRKKKRRRGTLEFADPNEDEVLSDQARKALDYAFTHFNDLASWKFNKARQNWLIRNFWSEEAIPETYMPLVRRYLANVQGGVHGALIKTCQDIIAPPAPIESTTEQRQASGQSSEPQPTSVALAPPSAPTTTDSVKQLRATALFAALTEDS